MPQSDPFISIVVPSYNRASFLDSTIPELLGLDYRNYEIIVVDDGSTDNTAEVVGRHADPKLRYFRKENEERAAARNFGAGKAVGEYVTFLDSDDILFSDALKNAATVIAEKDSPPFLHLAYQIGTRTVVSKTINGLKDNDPLIFVKGNPLSCMGVFIKREVFAQHRFNEDRALSASEDWEFWIRLAAHYGIRTDDKIVGRLIQHDTRSVMKISEDQLVTRMELAIKYAFADPAVRRVFGSHKRSIIAYWDTYIALHLAIDGSKRRAFHYLGQGIKSAPLCLFTRRGLVIFKFLLLKKS